MRNSIKCCKTRTDPFSTEFVPLTLTFPATPSATVQDSVSVSSTEYNYTGNFTEGGLDSPSFTDTDSMGRLWTLQITSGDPGVDSSISVSLARAGSSPLPSLTYLLSGNGGNLLSYEAEPIQLPELDNYSVGGVTFVEKSKSGPFHPLMVRIRGLGYPGSGQDTTVESEFTEAADLNASMESQNESSSHSETRKFVEWSDAPAGSPPDAVYLSGKDEETPGLFVLWETSGGRVLAFDYAGQKEKLGHASSFGEGFAKGFASGGVAMIGDGVTLAGNLLDKTKQYWNLLTKGPTGSVAQQVKADGEAVWGVGKAAVNLALAVKTFADNRITDGGDTVIAWLTGNDAKLNELSGRYGDAFSLSTEVFDYALEEISGASEGEQGLFMGRLTFEVASIFFAVTKASKANKLGDIAKADFLEELAKGEVFKHGSGPSLLTKITQYIAKLRATKMCFVAGTLVWCQVDGVARQVPIEQTERLSVVHPEMRVWSKDETTGEEAWKSPVAFFVTHPEELHNLSIDKDGDGQVDETLSGTPPHPFWVMEQEKFVPMGELQAGDTLYLAQGGSATVLENARERAPPGQTFTTYNFEVADFHTYFVGHTGVWVHNSGRTCEEIFSIWHNIFKREGSVARSYQRLKNLTPNMTQVAKEKTVWGLVQEGGEISQLKNSGKLSQKFIDLGTENGKFDPREAFVADRFEFLKGKNLTGRSDQGADFVETLADGSRRHWDAKGPFPGEFLDQQLPNILKGLDDHYAIHFANKDEFLVVDLAGLKPSAKKMIIDHLKALDPGEELFEILDNL